MYTIYMYVYSCLECKWWVESCNVVKIPSTSTPHSHRCSFVLGHSVVWNTWMG